MNDDRLDDANDDATLPVGDDALASGAMNDTRFDAWLHSAARGYNRPGDSVPRDAMWSAIERSLPATVVPMRPSRRANIWWQAAAALILLAGGIAIGRQWSGSGDVAPTVAEQEAPRANSEAGNDAPVARSLPPSSQLASAEAPTESGAEAPAGANTGSDGAPRRRPSASNESYDVATLEHLSRAEALLTSFRTPRSTGDGSPLNVWARDLLADTRLLLDSPAATDARRRQLLEDLELVLAQIVQLPAEASADRGLVQRSIERGAVLSRLRSSIPAGYSSGT